MEKDILNIRYHTDYRQCNYSCEYCIAGFGTTHPKPPDNWNPFLFKRIIKNITKLPHAINIRLGVMGEIFTSKELLNGAKILSHSDNIHSLNLITNLSLTVSQYEKIFQDFDRKKIAIVASFHPTEIKNMDEWIKTAKYMNKNYDFCCILVGYPKILDQLSDHKKMLQKQGLEVFVQPYIGPYEGKNYPYEYSPAEKKIVKDNIYSRHDWEFLMELKKPGMCSAGFNSIYVKFDGKVFPCGEGIYDNTIGDLSQSPNIKLNNSPTMCPFLTCQCDTENMNTTVFKKYYKHSRKNQHSYTYRYKTISKFLPFLSEWKVTYA